MQKLVAAALAFALSLAPSFAQSPQQLAIISDAGEAYNARFLQGCQDRLLEDGVGYECFLPQVQNGSAAEFEATIQSVAAAANVAGFLLQADSQAVADGARGILPTLGIPSIGWSATTIENNALPGELVVSVVGVFQADLAARATAFVTSYELTSLGVCPAIGISNGNTALLDEFVTSLRSLQDTDPIPAVCPLRYNFAAQLEEMIDGFSDQSVGTLLVLRHLDAAEFAIIEAALQERSPSTVLAAIGVRPYDLGWSAADTVLKVIPGETVEQNTALPPVIQVSTSAAYCSSCDCDTDDRCKRECQKCQ